jgi:hypothetical protein
MANVECRCKLSSQQRDDEVGDNAGAPAKKGQVSRVTAALVSVVRTASP